MKKKAIVAVVALVLVLCCAMGGTLAWLVAKTDPVVNTFTYGDINIDLSESDDLDLKMIPGNSIKKDPVVTVKKGSEACWLFVKVEKSSNFDTFMTCSVNTAENEWKELSSAASGNYKVYYREVAATTVDTDFAVLANNSVSVKETVTKDNLNALDANGANNYPTLTFTAYAVQRDTNITTAAQAWDIAMGNN